MIIGLSGYAKSGKDTAAAKLIADYGFEKASFAEVLRDCMTALDPVVDIEVKYEEDTGEVTAINGWRYSQVVDDLGYNEAKERFPEVRELLQRMGTEMGRKILGENVWVDAAMGRLEDGKNYVFTDVRFPNEAKAVKDAGGILVRITRPGMGPVNNHPSETSLDDYTFDSYITNDGSVEDLEGAISGLVELS